MPISNLVENNVLHDAKQKSPYVVFFPLRHRIFLTAVFLFYYISIAVWNSPDGSLKTNLMNLLRVPVDIFAVEQTWNMFGPSLRQWNGHLIASITFRDGSCKIYEFPRMEVLSTLQKYKREKLRKLFIDNMTDQAFESYLPSIARAIANANYQNGNEPQLVTITLKYADIPPPNETTLSSRHLLPQRANSRTLIVYRVQAEDLGAP